MNANGPSGASRVLPEPKPPGLGMVSISNFNLQMLQIVALRSQTVAGFRAKPKLLQTVHKLLQICCRRPEKTGGDGINFSRRGAACSSSAIA